MARADIFATQTTVYSTSDPTSGVKWQNPFTWVDYLLIVFLEMNTFISNFFQLYFYFYVGILVIQLE